MSLDSELSLTPSLSGSPESAEDAAGSSSFTERAEASGSAAAAAESLEGTQTLAELNQQRVLCASLQVHFSEKKGRLSVLGGGSQGGSWELKTTKAHSLQSDRTHVAFNTLLECFWSGSTFLFVYESRNTVF